MHTCTYKNIIEIIEDEKRTVSQKDQTVGEKLEHSKKEEWLQCVHDLCDNQCTVVIAFVMYQAQGCTQYSHAAASSIVFQK